MDQIITRIGHALLMAAGMFWQTGWSLVLGFFISDAVAVAMMPRTIPANAPCWRWARQSYRTGEDHGG